MSRCSGTTKSGSQCKKFSPSKFCHLHKGQTLGYNDEPEEKKSKKIAQSKGQKKLEIVPTPITMEPQTAGSNPSVYVGTSGYDFDHWQAKDGKANFFPPGTKKKDRFSVYASEFSCLEINASFYGNPSQKTWSNWRERAEKHGHSYVVKVTKHITHSKKLRDFEETFATFWEGRCEFLGDFCKCLLFQFSPAFKNTKQNREKLTEAHKVLKNYKLPDVAFEFRDKSWYDDETVEKDFEGRNWTFVLPVAVSGPEGLPGRKTTWIGNLPKFSIGDLRITSGAAYFRLHGSLGQYIGSYSDKFLSELAETARTLRNSGLSVYIMLNNTDSPWYVTENGVNIMDVISGADRDQTMSAVRDGRFLMGKLEA